MMAVALARLLTRWRNGVPRRGVAIADGGDPPGPAASRPRLVYLNITGSINPRPERLPISTVDPACCTAHGCS
ncbi:MAG: hypothetical protein KatS3mg059_1422 [Thermomicrobiales bacterium]|nr:MAG: hypothetical protein KatS3mg059_1422 [Thermomicrobiales bacterium]